MTPAKNEPSSMERAGVAKVSAGRTELSKYSVACMEQFEKMFLVNVAFFYLNLEP